MTEEDQLLVTRAALLGVRFWRTGGGARWTSSEYPSNDGMYTIGRAAIWALFKLEMVGINERDEYIRRTHDDAFHEASRRELEREQEQA